MIVMSPEQTGEGCPCPLNKSSDRMTYFTSAKWVTAPSACSVATSAWPALPWATASLRCLIPSSTCGFFAAAPACLSASSACCTKTSACPCLPCATASLACSKASAACLSAARESPLKSGKPTSAATAKTTSAPRWILIFMDSSSVVKIHSTGERYPRHFLQALPYTAIFSLSRRPYLWLDVQNFLQFLGVFFHRAGKITTPLPPRSRIIADLPISGEFEDKIQPG